MKVGSPRVGLLILPRAGPTTTTTTTTTASTKAASRLQRRKLSSDYAASFSRRSLVFARASKFDSSHDEEAGRGRGRLGNEKSYVSQRLSAALEGDKLENRNEELVEEFEFEQQQQQQDQQSSLSYFESERDRERGRNGATGDVASSRRESRNESSQIGPNEFPELLPEPQEVLEGYSRDYRAREMKSRQGRSRGVEGERLVDSLDQVPDEPVYASRRRRNSGMEDEPSGSSRRRKKKNLGALLSIGSVGGLVCVLSLLSYSRNQSSVKILDRESLTLTTLQSEREKGRSKLFGHARHQEADRGKLVHIQGAFRVELLRPSAARAFEQMKREARRDGINLHLVSGFRSIEHQEDLYFGIKAQRVQSSRERAMVSAPPGFSEHHTGYALDICDDRLVLDESFASTEAYRWLQDNARAFNFEMSFPANGEVAFEPWHWRFEGETEAIEAFYGK